MLISTPDHKLFDVDHILCLVMARVTPSLFWLRRFPPHHHLRIFFRQHLMFLLMSKCLRSMSVSMNHQSRTILLCLSFSAMIQVLVQLLRLYLPQLNNNHKHDDTTNKKQKWKRRTTKNICAMYIYTLILNNFYQYHYMQLYKEDLLKNDVESAWGCI